MHISIDLSSPHPSVKWSKLSKSMRGAPYSCASLNFPLISLISSSYSNHCSVVIFQFKRNFSCSFQPKPLRVSGGANNLSCFRESMASMECYKGAVIDSRGSIPELEPPIQIPSRRSLRSETSARPRPTVTGCCNLRELRFSEGFLLRFAT